MPSRRGAQPKVTTVVPAIEALVSGLRRQILAGELGPGSPLNQNQLATAFGLNRSQVREGLTVLSEERLVLMRPYATAVVAPLSLHEFQELHEVRMVLEPMLSRLALATVPRYLVLQMREVVQTMQETHDGATWLDANDEFHGLLYRQADRPWIVEIIDRARRLSSRYTRVLVFEMQNRNAEMEHVEILQAIEAQDAEKLVDTLIAHMKSGHDMVLQHLAQHPELLGSEGETISARAR